MEEPGKGIAPIFLAGDLRVSLFGEPGGRRGGEPNATVVFSGAPRIAALTVMVESKSFSKLTTSTVFFTGVTLTCSVDAFLRGLPSPSRSSSLRRTGICVTFFGLRGFFSAAASLVPLLAGVGGRRAGAACRPLGSDSLCAVGSMFSLSVSSNLTLFLTVGADLLTVPARVRVAAVVLLAGGWSVDVAVFLLGRPRAALGSSLGCVVEVLVAIRVVRVALTGSARREDVGSPTVPVARLGRPRRRRARASASLFSSSLSSARVFRLVAVLAVGAVAVDDGPAALALAAAVMILVVFTVDALALAAARARVIRFGGESIVVWVSNARKCGACDAVDDD